MPSRTTLIGIVLGVDFLLDFIIAFGGVILGGGAATGSASFASKGVLFLATVTGLVNAARTAQGNVRQYLNAGGAPAPAPPAAGGGLKP